MCRYWKCNADAPCRGQAAAGVASLLGPQQSRRYCLQAAAAADAAQLTPVAQVECCAANSAQWAICPCLMRSGAAASLQLKAGVKEGHVHAPLLFNLLLHCVARPEVQQHGARLAHKMNG